MMAIRVIRILSGLLFVIGLPFAFVVGLCDAANDWLFGIEIDLEKRIPRGPQ